MNVCAQTPTQQMARVGPPEPQINASSSTVKKQRGRPRTRQILEDRGDPSVPVPYNLMAKALPDGSGIQVTWAVPDIAEYPNLKPIGFNIIGQTNKKAIWSIKAEVKDPNAREAIIDRSLRKDCRYQYRITALYYTSTAIGQAESRRSHASQEVHWAFEDILASSRGPKSPRPAKMSKIDNQLDTETVTELPTPPMIPPDEPRPHMIMCKFIQRLGVYWNKQAKLSLDDVINLEESLMTKTPEQIETIFNGLISDHRYRDVRQRMMMCARPISHANKWYVCVESRAPEQDIFVERRIKALGIGMNRQA